MQKRPEKGTGSIALALAALGSTQREIAKQRGLISRAGAARLADATTTVADLRNECDRLLAIVETPGYPLID